jgi:hypothetical protein
MKTDTTVHTVSTPAPTMPASDMMSFLEKKLENKGNNSAISSALNASSTVARSVPLSGPIDVQWNALKPVSRSGSPAAELPTSIKSSLKLLNDAQPSLASLVLSFMTMSLQIFANLQKANMDMAINQLNSIKLDMIRQIKEMKDEKDATFKKDMIMGVIEAVSSAVQLAGSAYTTAKLKGKMVEQETLFGQKNADAKKISIENETAQADPRIDKVNNLIADDNLNPNLKSQTKSDIADIKAVLDDAKASQANANSAIKPALTPEEIKIQSEKIGSEVAYINARQQAFSGLAALIKAGSPFVQGSLGADATTHQISAKEAENSKEIANSLYRQYIDWAAAYRDSISRMLANFEDVQKQDAENSLAASRKMV